MSKPMKEERLREIEDGLAEGKKNHTLDYYPPRTVNELVREVRRLQGIEKIAREVQASLKRNSGHVDLVVEAELDDALI